MTAGVLAFSVLIEALSSWATPPDVPASRGHSHSPYRPPAARAQTKVYAAMRDSGRVGVEQAGVGQGDDDGVGVAGVHAFERHGSKVRAILQDDAYRVG